MESVGKALKDEKYLEVMIEKEKIEGYELEIQHMSD